MRRIVGFALILFATSATAETTTYRVMFGGEDVGHMIVNQAENRIAIDYDFKQNGRGPTMAEELTLDSRGYPIDWTITGTTTFGSSVDEFFRFADGTASWQDSTGPGEATTGDVAGFYINQNGSPYSGALLVSALLSDDDGRLEVLPGGEASVVTRETRSYDGPDGELEVTAYEILGLSYNPGLVMLDGDGRFFATASPRFAMVREGYESADEDLRGWAEALSTERFVEIQADVAHSYDEPVRIRNVRIFDPIALELTEL